MAKLETLDSVESHLNEPLDLNPEQLLEIETNIKNVIRTMLWCNGGISLKTIRENAALVELIFTSIRTKLNTICGLEFGDIIVKLVENWTCPETMGRILVLLKTESQKRLHRKNKGRIGFSTKSSFHDKFITGLKNCSPAIGANPSSEDIKRATKYSEYVRDCKFYAENPGSLKNRFMKKQADVTLSMSTLELERFRQAREQNSYFQIQPELRKWLQNSKTSKLLLAILAHDLTLQHIDNFLRNPNEDITLTTFF